MAYITTEEVKQIRKNIKKAFPSIKFSITMEHNSTVSCAIIESDIDFSDYLGEREYASVNEYTIEKKFKNDSVKFNLFSELTKLLRTDDYYDNSEPMTDYFDTSHYISLSIGKWNKPYKQIK